jgi:tetratricopeptide (TPR) repeat protein
MTSKSAIKAKSYKIPVALFVVALTVLAQGVIARVGRANDRPGLPNPRDMAVLSLGRQSATNIVKLWEGRVDASPTSSAYRARLASSLLSLARQTGDLSLYEQAEGVARMATQLDPKSDTADLTLAAALAAQHDFPGALALAKEVLRRQPTSVNARLAIGDASLELGDYDRAETIYEGLAVELAGVPSMLSRQARLLVVRGRTDEATELARQALIAAGQQDLDSYEAAFYWFQFANYLFQNGRYGEAEKMLRAALEVQPEHLGSIELLGKVLVALGKFEEATKLYETILKRTDAADLRWELARLYAHAGRAHDAELQTDLGSALAKKAAVRFPAERRHLIGFYADTDPTEAVRLARADVELRQDVYSYGWLAWALLQAGQPNEAVPYADQALAQGTRDAWLLYQAGSVFAAVGDTARARVLLSDALEMSPQFDLVHAQRARDLLATLTE